MVIPAANSSLTRPQIRQPLTQTVQTTFQTLATFTGTAALIGLLTQPALAKDPFRTVNQRPIGDKTEMAFRAMFEQGNYIKAQEFLNQAEKTEGNDPLVPALQASLAFANSQGDSAQQQAASGRFSTYAQQTRQKAEQLVKTDPLRGNLYMAVGNFLDAAHTVGSQGVVRGMPTALNKLQDAFKQLEAAEKVDPNDAELNLIKGTMDLMLAVNVNLPLASADQAIGRLDRKAGPRYIVDRSLAWGYRDLKQYDKAMNSVESALKGTPDNPELHYLKAQIFVKKKNYPEAIKFFDQALTRKTQLPNALVSQIERERRRANQQLTTAK
ncbi:MAG: Sll0314/Alr1548 family TPR repeat-containing protein [Synechococcales bacterium]|nr:Sll0314/Alr1548 family TPR repeat-containing protein [Synechococcales bacterium]